MHLAPHLTDAPAPVMARHLAGFYQRGWCVGTGGNFSIVASRNPYRLLITASGVEKGEVHPERDFVLIDVRGEVLEGAGKPSAETGIHLVLTEDPSINAVYHTHSTWGTILSRLHGAEGGFAIEDYEMLKGLERVITHEHREWIPILDNSQDIPFLSEQVRRLRTDHPEIHGFYLHGHGLYTWGKTAQEARRHVEVFEFLFEVTGRLELAHRAGGVSAAT